MGWEVVSMTILNRILAIPILILLMGAFLHMLFRPRTQLDAAADPKGRIGTFALIGFGVCLMAFLKVFGCNVLRPF